MSKERHGIMIGIERSGSTFYLCLAVMGTLTHDDYQLITPLLDSALANVEKPRLNVLVDARELEGWDAHAAWDDLKLGIKHGREFDKIAIVGNKRWQELAAKTGSWFISGEARFFSDYESAQHWLRSVDADSD